MNRGRRAKDTEVAEVTVDMQSLKSGSETEDWYHLTGVTPIGKLTNTLYGSFLQLLFCHPTTPSLRFPSLEILQIDCTNIYIYR